MLEGKKIILGVTGSIAAYKAVDIARQLVQRRAEVQTVMTAAAQEFIAPLTLETITGRPVRTDMFGSTSAGIVHLESADMLLVAPATANILSKAATGIADDLLSTMIMAFKGPVVFCPAMNPNMYKNPVFKKNLSVLKGLGYKFCGPEVGNVVCGDEGRGRLAGIDQIIDVVQKHFRIQDLAGLRILITAGPTSEPLDIVRFLSNRSSGKMGYAIAIAAQERGAEVTLISGPVSLPAPGGLHFVSVRTAAQMFAAVKAQIEKQDIIIMAAAVSDYRPAQSVSGKVAKTSECWQLSLEPTEDILAYAGKNKGPRQIVVGFAAEAGNPEANALAKLKRKKADLIIGNDLTSPGAGFEVDTNIVHLVYADGTVYRMPKMEKRMLAEKLLDKIISLREAVFHD